MVYTNIPDDTFVFADTQYLAMQYANVRLGVHDLSVLVVPDVCLSLLPDKQHPLEGLD